MKTPADLHVTRLQFTDEAGEPVLVKIEGGDSKSVASFIATNYLNNQAQAVVEEEQEQAGGNPNQAGEARWISEYVQNLEEPVLLPTPPSWEPKPTEQAAAANVTDNEEEIPLMPVINWARKAA